MKQKIPCLLCCIILSLTACQGKSIPLEDIDGNVIKKMTLRQNRGIRELNISPISEGAGILGILLAYPADPLTLEILDQYDILMREKTIDPVPGLFPGQGILEFQFEYPPEMRKLRMRGKNEQNFPDIFGLSFHTDYSGFQFDSYHMVLPETIRYQQEIYSSAPGSAVSPLIYQELQLSNSFQNFDRVEKVPVFSLEYEYTVPENGMPLKSDHGHSADHIHGDDDLPHPAPPLAEIEILSEKRELIGSWKLTLRPGIQRVYFYPESFTAEAAVIRFTHNSEFGRLRSFRLETKNAHADAPENLEPLPIDLGMLMNYSSVLWRHNTFELFTWNLFPEVHIFDFADYAVQARFLKRLAFFTEKTESRGTLLSNAELIDRHGWNAHNYHARDLARFYSQALRENFELNPEEILLRNVLLKQGIIVNEAGNYGEGEGQILSVSVQPGQADAARQLFLNHEALHGVFYNHPPLRNVSFALWEDMSADTREYITYYFSYFDYDKSDEYLLVNEFQAYMLQQNVDDLSWIVQNRMSERIGRWAPRLRNFLNRTKAQASEELLADAEYLQDVIYQDLGLIAGDLFCLVEN